MPRYQGRSEEESEEAEELIRAEERRDVEGAGRIAEHSADPDDSKDSLSTRLTLRIAESVAWHSATPEVPDFTLSCRHINSLEQ